MNVWENTSSSNGGIVEEFGELFIISDGELYVSWNYS